MAATSVPRVLTNSIRQIGRSRPRIYAEAFKRAASTKHPTGFSPPSTEELTELKERVQDFIRREIPEEVAARTDSENAFPNEMWRKFGEAGSVAHPVPPSETPSPTLDHNALTSEGSIGLSYAAHSQLCINQLSLNGTPEQKSKFLPGLVSGETIGALAMSEHSAGSDVVSMKTAARKVEGGYELNGTKMWITNGPDAHIIIVYAKTEPDKGSKGITAFIVDTSTPGFSCARKLDKLGMRGSNTGEIVFENVFVPEQNVLGEVNRGVKVLMEGLDIERLVLSAGPLGIMQSALDISLPYTHSRTQFSIPIAHNQLIQAKLADMYTSLSASRAYTYATARTLDESSTGQVETKDCAGAILFAAERATQVALDAVQLMGGMGYVNEVAAGRLVRDAKLYEIGAGTSEVRRMVIGRAFNREFARR
ncbi:MAG: hypothetical protein Q9170_006599 [Blastenia crenularia]